MIVLLAGLFGHRRPDDPFYVQWIHTATQWVGAHWAVLGVLIPVAGAIAAGIVNHYLAVARENRARRFTQGALRARVHADLAARLLAHCTQIALAVDAGRPDPHAWRSGNADLRRRGEMHDVIEVLGTQYVTFMAAIEHERRALDALEAGRTDRRRVSQSASTIVAAYVPFICDFGEERQARRLARMVR